MTPIRLAAVTLAGSLAACSPGTEERRPQQAEPLNPLTTTVRLIAADAAAVFGDHDEYARQQRAIADDLQRAMRIPDPNRSIDPESARQAARRVPGVRSVVWLDREHLFAIVEQNAQRSQATIDRICLELEPLGDTLGVVVNLQSGSATHGDDLEILSRNCQLAAGERAFMQRARQIDVIAPTVRAQHRANQSGQRSGRERRTD